MTCSVAILKKSESQCFSCTWTFPVRYLVSRVLTSPSFKTTIHDRDDIWYLEVYKDDLTHDRSLNLVLQNPERNARIDVKSVVFTMPIRNKTIADVQKCEHIFTESSKCIRYSNFFNRITREKNGFFYLVYSDKDVTVVCEITYLCDKKIEESNDDSSLPDDLKLLLHNEKFSDLTIVVEQQEFRVHKAILASRSSVFLAMLENDMIEKQSNRVEINDIDYETMKHVLLYVYTGKVENLELAGKLLGPSEKYALKGLKNICTNKLSDSLTVENAVEILMMADLYGSSELKEKTIDFMSKRFKDVAETEGFQLLLKSNSKLFKAA